MSYHSLKLSEFYKMRSRESKCDMLCLNDNQIESLSSLVPLHAIISTELRYLGYMLKKSTLGIE